VHDGKLHSIEVRLSIAPATNAPGTASDQSSYRVDHRQAYVAPPPEQE
jgi:hypothetical protein